MKPPKNNLVSFWNRLAFIFQSDRLSLSGKRKYLDGKANMNARVMIPTKGSVVCVEAIGSVVQVWVQSPTGDASDSFIFNIPCQSADQAKVIREMWKGAWGL